MQQEKAFAKKLVNGEFVIIVLLLVMSVAVLVISSGYPFEARRFPQLVAAVNLVLACQQLYVRYKAAKTAQDTEKNKEEEKATNWIFVLGVMVAYFLVVRPLGFIITNTIAMLAIPYYLGYRKWTVLVVYALATSLVAYYIFRGIFYVPLPKGILNF